MHNSEFLSEMNKKSVDLNMTPMLVSSIKMSSSLNVVCILQMNSIIATVLPVTVAGHESAHALCYAPAGPIRYFNTPTRKSDFRKMATALVVSEPVTG